MKLEAKYLPNLTNTLRRLQSIAMLDAIICPEWEYRYYSFNAQWDTNEMMGSMRDGQADQWFILLGDFGAAIKGFSSASTIDLTEELPQQLPPLFHAFLNEPAFTMDKVSYCYGYDASNYEASWHKVFKTSLLDDFSYEALSLIVEPVDAYLAFANEYFEISLTPHSVQAIYDHKPLTNNLVQSINPDITINDLLTDISEIGYPAML